MEKDKKRDWKQTWWGILIMVAIFPIFISIWIWQNKKWEQKAKVIAIAMIAITTLVLLGSLISTDVDQKNLSGNDTNHNQNESIDQTESQLIDRNDVIAYEVLRSWSPDNNDIRMELLINESDATEDNIVTLVNFLSSDAERALIMIYQDKRAWDDEKSSIYSDKYDRGYLVCYIKNLSESEDGTNEIRWMQESGQFEDLYGTKTFL